MIDKSRIKSHRMILYITYTVLFTFVVFHFQTVFQTLFEILTLATPLYIAIVIAFILNIPMSKIEYLYEKKILKKGIRRGLAIMTTLIIMLVIVLFLSGFIIPRLIKSISMIIMNIFSYSQSLVSLINDILVKFHIDYKIDYSQIQNLLSHIDFSRIISQNSSLGHAGIRLIFQTFGIFSVVINGFTSFIMALYLLANKETHIRQVKKIVTFLFGYKRALLIFDIGTEANHYFNGFISGQLLEACILTSLMYLGFRMTGIPYPELLSFVIGIVSFVPMFGCYAGFAVSLILTLAIQPSKALIFVVCFVIIQQFEANLIYPKVVGNAVGISGLYVLLSLVVFGNLFGFFGLLIAVPSMALIYAVGSRFINISLYRKHIEVTDKKIELIKDE